MSKYITHLIVCEGLLVGNILVTEMLQNGIFCFIGETLDLANQILKAEEELR